MADLSFDDLIPTAKSGGGSYGDAIASIESAGSGNYRAVGPATRAGDRAYGRYQIMGANIRPWSQEVLGREVTTSEFMSDPKLQDAIFEGKFGQYVQKYGPEGAARAWFAGEGGMNDLGRRDQLGTSVGEYARRFSQALPAQAMGFAPEQAARSFPPKTVPEAPKTSALSFDDLIPQQAELTAEQVAREQLAQGLREGRRSDQDVYLAAAFRTNQGVPAAGATAAAVRGATGGFADEISAAARAPIDMLARGESYDEAYQHNLAAERDRLEQYRKASPIASTAAEVAGSLAMPVGRAGALRTGAATGALYGAGNSEGDIAQRAADAATGGLVGAGAAGAIAGIGRAIAGKAPSAAPSIEELRKAAKAGYESDAVKGLELAPKAVSDAAVGIRARLDEAGFDEIIAPKAHAILKRLEAMPEGAVSVSGQNLRSAQKTLGKAAGAIDPQEKAGAMMALNAFNEFLEGVPAGAVIRGSADDFARTVKEANANYSAAKTAESLDKTVTAAELRASASNSGMNVANTIRQRMATVANNPRLSRGMRPDERAQVESIAKGSKVGNALRTVGNIAGGGGGLGSLVSGGAGVLAAGPAGLALPLGGMALRALGNRMTLRQAEKLSEAIRSRAPLASATSKFEERVAQFYENRNTRTASAAALAARNLATNLRGAGFNVSTSDLMRALQAPVASRAEDDQPNVPRPPGQ